MAAATLALLCVLSFSLISLYLIEAEKTHCLWPFHDGDLKLFELTLVLLWISNAFIALEYFRLSDNTEKVSPADFSPLLPSFNKDIIRFMTYAY